MDSDKIKKIFEAIKTDDVKLFASLVESKNDLSVCYGRFPVLSLCYLYKSYAILNQYEDTLMTVKAYQLVQEYYEMYLQFKKYAKKSLRLYLNNEIIAPVEMLAIIDDRELIAKNYKKYQNNDQNVSKIRKIYSLTHSTDVEIDRNKFIAPCKKNIFESKLITSIIAVILCFMIIFPTFSILFVKTKFGLGTLSSPIAINNENDFVSAISKGSMSYVLKDDLYFNENIDVESFKGTINGNNKTLYLDYDLKKPIFENFSGVLQNLKIVVTFGKVMVSENLAIVAKNLSGSIDNCEIFGSITGEFVNIDDSYFSLFVYHNQEEGLIKNSRVEVSVNVTNSATKNAYLTAFTGKNDGKIVNCSSISSETAGLFEADTVDMSCFAGDNNGTIEGCINNISMTQTSSGEWHPNTTGIALNNYGNITNCVNNGDILSSTTNATEPEDEDLSYVVYSAGIVVNNEGTISNCINEGNIKASSIIACSYASGISVINNYVIENSTNNGDIEALSQKFEIFISGITCYNSFTYEKAPEGAYNIIKKISSIVNCTNTGKIKATETEKVDKVITIYAGGISAFNYTAISNSSNTGGILCSGNSARIYSGGVVGYINNISEYLNCSLVNCKSSGNMNISSKSVYVGGISGYSSYTKINDCSSTNLITVNSPSSYVGGMCGIDKQSTLLNNTYKGNIDIQSNRTYSGGFIGYSMITTINNCYAGTNINKSNYSGTDDELVIESPNGGEIQNSYSYVAMIAGYYENNSIYSNQISCSNLGYVGTDNKTLFWFFNSFKLDNVLEVTSIEGVTSYTSFKEMEDAYKKEIA